MTSKIVRRQTKIKINTTFIRPVMYECESWLLTKNNEEKLRIIEWKIYGPSSVNGII